MRTRLPFPSTASWSTPTIVIGFLGTVSMALLGCLGAGLRMNVSGSIPIGLYHVVGEVSHVKRGELVLACLPEDVAEFAHSRGYVPRGGRCPGDLSPVGKFVMAIPGDTVTVSPTGLSVNHISVPQTRPLGRDGHGRPLREFPEGTYIVGPNAIWLVGSSIWSFDSRYTGPVAYANLLARLRQI